MLMAESNSPNVYEPAAWPAAGQVENTGLPLHYDCSSIADFQQKLSQLVHFHSTALIPEFIQADFYLGAHLTIEIDSPTSLETTAHNEPTVTLSEGDTGGLVASTTPSTTPSAKTKSRITIPIHVSLNDQPTTHPDLQKAVAKSIFTMVGEIDGFGWSTRNLNHTKDGWRLQHACADSRYNMSRAANQGRGKGKRGKPSTKNVENAAENDEAGGDTATGPLNGHQTPGEEADSTGQVPNGGEGEQIDGQTASSAKKRGRPKSGFSNLPVYDCSGLTTCVFSSTRQVLIVKYSHCPVHRTVADRKRLEKIRVAQNGQKYRRRTGGSDVGGNGFESQHQQQHATHSTPSHWGYGERNPGLNMHNNTGTTADPNANGEADAEGEEEEGIDPGMQLLREWNQSVHVGQGIPQQGRN